MITGPYTGKPPWRLVLPAAVVGVGMVAGALLITVALAVHDIRDPFARTFVGGDWFAAVILDPALHAAVLHQIIFTGVVLAIEVPLGVAIAFALPRHGGGATLWVILLALPLATPWGDRKSTRLNSSHAVISYAVFCLKKKKHSMQHNLQIP